MFHGEQPQNATSTLMDITSKQSFMNTPDHYYLQHNNKIIIINNQAIYTIQIKYRTQHKGSNYKRGGGESKIRNKIYNEY